jgi:hypothetical protein
MTDLESWLLVTIIIIPVLTFWVGHYKGCKCGCIAGRKK